jgi:rod shape-determining protein MreC
MKNLNLIIVLIVIAIAGFILSPAPFFKDNLGLIRQILSPFSSSAISSSAKVPVFWQTLVELKKLVKENRQLKEENRQLEAKLTRLLEVERENQALKQEMKIKVPDNNQGLIFAKIIARSPSSFNQTIFIAAGQRQNVKEGDPVMAQGFLIGKVEEVDEYTSEVILTSNHRFLAPVILADSRALGLMRGGIEGIVVEQIPADVEIREAEMVLTSDIVQDLPGNLPVGRISDILSEKSNIFQTASIALPFNFNSLETVLIYQR